MEDVTTYNDRNGNPCTYAFTWQGRRYLSHRMEYGAFIWPMGPMGIPTDAIAVATYFTHESIEQALTTLQETPQ